jgi:hypothetical protein
MVVIDPTLASGPSGYLPAGQKSFGGVTISSTGQLLAGSVFEHHIDASPATYLKSARLFGQNEADTTVYVPLIKYKWPQGNSATTPNAAKWSGLSIYNADTIQVTVNITYTLTGRNGSTTHADVGTKYYQSATIDPGNINFFLFYDAAWANPPAGTQPGDKFTAKISATGDVVAIVNEEGNFALSGNIDKATYSAFPSSTASTKVSLPKYKEQWNGKFHGATVYNTSNNIANVTAKITVVGAKSGLGASAGDTVWIQTTIPANGSVDFLMSCFLGAARGWTDVTDGSDTKNMVDLCNGSNPTLGTNNAMIIESNQLIVVLANEELAWWVSESSVGDGQGEDASNYEGFPLE